MHSAVALWILGTVLVTEFWVSYFVHTILLASQSLFLSHQKPDWSGENILLMLKSTSISVSFAKLSYGKILRKDITLHFLQDAQAYWLNQ